MSETDLQLLARFNRDQAEDAFAELVRRHLDLVHSAALRQVRSPQLAEEVAQSVFTDLARNADKLKPDTILTAWLYQVTRRTTIDVVRCEARRQLREQIATEMNAMNATTADWTNIEPLLDEAMSALDETDRTAVLLRYFENKSFHEVGATLGTSDDAAQKRVSRAVERLREFFTKHGVTVSASGLVIVISANAVQAAPGGLAVAISTATAACAGTAIGATATATATKAIAMTTLQKALISATLVAGLATPLVIQHQAHVKLRDENRQQLNALAQLQADNERLSNQLAQANSTSRLPNEQFNELLRLRGEVGSLRRQTNELAGLHAENQRLKAPLSAANAQPKTSAPATSPQESLPRESWSFLGYADPESAFQSTVWSMSQGDAKTYLASLAPEGRESKNAQGKSETELAEKARQEMDKVTAFKIIEKEAISDSEVILTIYASGVNQAARFRLHRIGNEWKFGGPMKDGGQAGTK